jgi:hypothetical protein
VRASRIQRITRSKRRNGLFQSSRIKMLKAFLESLRRYGTAAPCAARFPFLNRALHRRVMGILPQETSDTKREAQTACRLPHDREGVRSKPAF